MEKLKLCVSGQKNIEEILFGKKYKSKGKPREYNLYTRASKLLSAYKLKD